MVSDLRYFYGVARRALGYRRLRDARHARAVAIDRAHARRDGRL